MGPNRGPKLVHRFAADVRQKNGGSAIGVLVWVPNWVPQFGSHRLGPMMWVLIWFPDEVSEFNSGQIAFRYPEIESSRTYPSPGGLAGPGIVHFWGSKQPPSYRKTHWKRWGA